MLDRFRALPVILACAVAASGCSSHAEKTAARSVSPLIGTWTRDGNIPKSGSSGPQFTRLTFAASGDLKADYAAGGIGAIVGSAPSVKSEDDTYSATDTTLSIAEGTTQRSYTYRVSGAKLYLTPPGGGDAAVFSKAS